MKSVSVRYRSTGKTVSEDRLKNLLATQPGTSYSPEVVNKDLERLLESGLVGGNTTVAVEPSSDGVAVVFEMAAQNLLGGVGFRGNTAFDNRDLSEECGLKGGEALSDKALSSAIAKLRTYYQEARYPDVRVSYFYQKTERPGFVDVVFDINEGKKANIIKIDFVGNEHISAKDLRQVMKTKEKGWLTWITKSGRIDREQEFFLKTGKCRPPAIAVRRLHCLYLHLTATRRRFHRYDKLTALFHASAYHCQGMR